MRPPRKGVFSTSVTRMPRLARSRVATRPATPPPMTSADGWIMIRRLASGCRCRIRPTAARTRRAALRVAASLSSTTHDTCSRMFTCSKRNWFNPARFRVRRKVNWWSVGEQAATMTRFRPSSRIFSSMSIWPGSEHMNMCVVESTTSGSRPISSATRRTSTTSEMFPPQWQMKTPMRMPSAGGVGGRCVGRSAVIRPPARCDRRA